MESVVGESVRVRFWDWGAARIGTIEPGATPGYYCFCWGRRGHECRELPVQYEAARIERRTPDGEWKWVGLVRA